MLAAANAAPAHGQTSAPADAPPTTHPDAAHDEPMEALIARLAAPLEATRRQSAEKLALRGPAIYEPLARAFAVSSSYEEKRRIRQVAERVFYEQKLGPMPPFLGIQYEEDDESDPRLAREPRVPNATRVGVAVRDVIPGTAASDCGLLRGDFIVAVNGQPLLKSPSGRAFPQWIVQQQVGARCELAVYRGQTRMTVATRLRRRPVNVPGALPQQALERAVALRAEFVSWWRANFDPSGALLGPSPADRDPAWQLSAPDR